MDPWNTWGITKGNYGGLGFQAQWIEHFQQHPGERNVVHFVRLGEIRKGFEWGFPELEIPSGGLYTKDYNIWESIWGFLGAPLSRETTVDPFSSS